MRPHSPRRLVRLRLGLITRLGDAYESRHPLTERPWPSLHTCKWTRRSSTMRAQGHESKTRIFPSAARYCLGPRCCRPPPHRHEDFETWLVASVPRTCARRRFPRDMARPTSRKVRPLVLASSPLAERLATDSVDTWLPACSRTGRVPGQVIVNDVAAGDGGGRSLRRLTDVHTSTSAQGGVEAGKDSLSPLRSPL